MRPGLVNFITAVAYHFCLSLPAAFTQPGRSLLADPCILEEPREGGKNFVFCGALEQEFGAKIVFRLVTCVAQSF